MKLGEENKWQSTERKGLVPSAKLKQQGGCFVCLRAKSYK